MMTAKKDSIKTHSLICVLIRVEGVMKASCGSNSLIKEEKRRRTSRSSLAGVSGLDRQNDELKRLDIKYKRQEIKKKNL